MDVEHYWIWITFMDQSQFYIHHIKVQIFYFEGVLQNCEVGTVHCSERDRGRVVGDMRLPSFFPLPSPVSSPLSQPNIRVAVSQAAKRHACEGLIRKCGAPAGLAVRVASESVHTQVSLSARPSSQVSNELNRRALGGGHVLQCGCCHKLRVALFHGLEPANRSQWTYYIACCALGPLLSTC
jgi:hypothetical protein